MNLPTATPAEKIVSAAATAPKISKIEVTMNVYTHIGFEDATEELKKLEEARKLMEEDKGNVKERRLKVI